jgi:galactokinase
MTTPPSTKGEITADAPGRVNLIGEHTDYAGGFVLPIATPHRTRVTVKPRSDDLVIATSGLFSGDTVTSYRIGEERRTNTWLDYLQGVTWAVSRSGRKIRGFEVHVESNLPMGAGLASSAALEFALLRALRKAFDLWLDDLEVGLTAHAAETGFVGVPVGVMDQLAASLADVEHALFLDTRSLAVERVATPEDAELLVVDSGVAHEHAHGGFRTRRAEVDAAAQRLGVPELRDASPLLDHVAALPPPLNRRARHVITENARVLAAVAALKAGDLVEFGKLLVQSHESLRDDFEVSVPAVEHVVKVALSQPFVFGARMTGGGFGGAVLVLCRRPHARAVGERILARSPGARLVIPMDAAGSAPIRLAAPQRA